MNAEVWVEVDGYRRREAEIAGQRDGRRSSWAALRRVGGAEDGPQGVDPYVPLNGNTNSFLGMRRGQRRSL